MRNNDVSHGHNKQERQPLLTSNALIKKADLLPANAQPRLVQLIQAQEKKQTPNINTDYHSGFVAAGYDVNKPVAVFLADWAEVPHHAWAGIIDMLTPTHRCFLITHFAHGVIHYDGDKINQKTTDEDGYTVLLKLSKKESQYKVDAHIETCLQYLDNIDVIFAAGISAKQIAQFRHKESLQRTGIASANIILTTPYLQQDLDSVLLLKLKSVLQLGNFPAACLPTNPCISTGCVDLLIAMYSWASKGAVFKTQLSHTHGGVFYYDCNNGVANTKIPLNVLSREYDRLDVFPTPIYQQETPPKLVVICNRADPYMTGAYQHLRSKLQKNFPDCSVEGLEIRVNGKHALTHLLADQYPDLLKIAFERVGLALPATFNDVSSNPQKFTPKTNNICNIS